MHVLSTREKLEAVKEVVVGGRDVQEVSNKYKCTRQALYLWVKKYKQDPKKALQTLKNKYKFGKNHPKSLSWRQEKMVLDLVVNSPRLSVHGIRKSLSQEGVKISLHGIENILVRYDLQRAELRQVFSKSQAVKSFFAHKLAPAYRAKIVEEYIEEGVPIARICRRWKISRVTFYEWLKRYREGQKVTEVQTGGEVSILESLIRRYKKGEMHHRTVGADIKEAILAAVRENPTYSVHKILAMLPTVNGRPIAGHHAVQNVLFRESLNTLAKRLEWAGGFVPEPKASAIEVYETPIPKLSTWRLLFAPFKTVPKWVFGHPGSWPIVFPVTIFLAWIIEVDKLFNPAFFFPTIALTFGMFFFLYSLKYYFSLIMVMKVAQGGSGDNKRVRDNYSNQGPQTFSMRVKRIVTGSVKISQPISKVNPLALNFSKVELLSKPFVSIHAPIYNEKRVVERLIKACSSQNWYDDKSQKANFEVVIIDDSTDATTEIVKQKLSEDGRKITRSVFNEEVEVYVSEKAGGPNIKLIHRFNRQGYKGAALGNAMNYTDPRAEYIAVFDADFVPYPDTIEQFMKSFQEACGGLEKVSESKIAAVQGYQWHVLNKSENWVTRGVRTEYAGSYVVERAGIGIYGGLNQIAGSVFCIRVDVLKAFGWRTSITEDLQLTLRLYEQGFKVVFNPYIQAPAEAVSTVKRLIRQRMRWAEGHTFNVKNMWLKMIYSQRISGREKFEFMYLAPYYMQAAFFLIGVTAWFISEVVLHTRLPFWTAAWGWSLVFTNFLALPLMNLAGLFLEESEERDYVGVASFMLLSYVVVPFQAYAAVKALFETEEGPWFRTPKTGLITDAFDRGKFYGWVEKLKMLRGVGANSSQLTVNSSQLTVHGGFGERFNFARVSAHNPLSGYRIMPRRAPRVSRGVIASLVVVVLFLNSLAFFAPPVKAISSTPALEQQLNIKDSINSNVSTSTYVPTDESQGLVNYDASKYSGTVQTFFEAVAKVASTDGSVGAGTSIFCFSTTDCSIAYYDASNGALKYAHCTTATCTSPAPTITTLDGHGCTLTNCDANANVGKFPSVGCWSASSACSVSYYDVTNGNLKYIGCTNENCTTTGLEGVQTLDSGGDVGAGTSINCTVSSSSCTIAYRDSTNSSLKLLLCGFNALNCDTRTTYKVDGASDCAFTGCDTGTADVGQYPSLSIVFNSVFINQISYYDATSGNLKFARCTSTGGGAYDCDASTQITAVESTNDVGLYTSITCLTSTDCKIAHYDNTNGDLRFIDCGDVDCATGNTASLLDGNTGCTLTTATACSTTTNVGQYTSIYCPTGTDCKISYYDVTNANLKFADCGDATCGSGSAESTYSTGDVGSYSSISCTSASGCQIVHYNAKAAGDLLFTDCSVAACTSAATTNIIDLGAARFIVGLFASGNTTTPVAGSEISFTSTGYALVRSGAITLTTGTDYTVRFHTDTAQFGSIDAARIVITQTASGSITGTQAQVEVGGVMTISAGMTTYTDLTSTKFYCFSGNATCASATVWTPAPTVYFEATMADSGGGTVYAQLYDITAVAAVSGSEVSTTNTSYTRVRSSAITLTAGHQYKVQVKQATVGGFIKNAKIILDQGTPTGITATEVVQTYNNAAVTGTQTTYTSQGYPNKYTSANFSGSTITRYIESTFFWTQKSGGSIAYVTLSTAVAGEEVSTSSTTAVFQRHSVTEPSGTSVDVDVQAKGNTTSTYTSNVTNLVLQMSSMPVPESSLLILPLVLFLPFITKRLRLRRKNMGVLEVKSE